MNMSLKCGRCGQALWAREENAGRKLRCPGCGEILMVPGRAPAIPPPLPFPSSEGIFDRVAAPPPLPGGENDPQPRKKRRRRSTQASSMRWLWLGGAVVVAFLLGIGLTVLLVNRTPPTEEVAAGPPKKTSQPPAKNKFDAAGLPDIVQKIEKKIIDPPVPIPEKKEIKIPMGSPAGVEGYFPPDTRLVLKIDFQKLLNSSLAWNQVLTRLGPYLKDPDVDRVKNGLGFDFLALTHVTLALPDIKGDGGLAILEGRFDPVKIKDVAEKAGLNPPMPKSTKRIFQIQGPLKKKLFLMLPNPNTLLISLRRKELLPVLFLPIPPQPAPEVNNLCNSLRDPALKGATISLAVAGGFRESGGLTLREISGITSIRGGLFLNRDARGIIDLDLPDDTAAGNLYGQMIRGLADLKTTFAKAVTTEALLAPLEPLLNCIRIGRRNKTVTLEGQLSAREIQDLVASPLWEEILRKK